MIKWCCLEKSLTFCNFLNRKSISWVIFEDMKGIQRSFVPYQKKGYRGASINWKPTGISVLNSKEIIWKKIKISFVLYFYLGKYSLSLNTFWTHLVFWRKLMFHSWFICLDEYSFSLDTFSTQLECQRKLMFHSLFISVLVNTAIVSILFQHTSYFKENERFIHCSFLPW